ncbi:hypothetical protein niasHS_014773 [Heterodera schachtii]|uniref:Uncharacterized protein n=1 Tax=Heterodera schachtii TaxID=97005 RepID=A0ABD2IIN7_HETSC
MNSTKRPLEKNKKDSIKSITKERKLELRNIAENGQIENENKEEDESDQESEEGEESDDGEVMPEIEDGNDQSEEMAKLDFEFEALPPAEDDLEDIERLLIQIFLQAEVDEREMAKAVVGQSPMGCVFRPAEESEDDESEAITYGVLSIVPLNGTENFQSQVAELVLHRSKKHATDEIFKKFANVLDVGRMSSKVGFLINERMLNFPAQIAGPAFHSLAEDYNGLTKERRFEHILAILKVRICTEQCASSSSSPNVGKKRKLGKAARKRLAVERTIESDVIFDNLEEQLLFQDSSDFPFFQYPVESEIEKSSKFHSLRRDGRIFRPFRRVCLLSVDQFLQFASSVVRSFSV